MTTINYRITEAEIDPRKFVSALVTLVVQQFNQLRAFHGLPALTRQQVIDAIKAEIKNQ
jgi:formate-dependent phosphoribosylglycinamide formyltransferase (GAR transformylase)